MPTRIILVNRLSSRPNDTNEPIRNNTNSLVPARAVLIHSVIETLNGNMAKTHAIDKGPTALEVALVTVYL